MDNQVFKRFISKFVKSENGCWEWQGKLKNGYGDFYANGKTYRAHRFSHELFKGKITRRLVIDHLCRNRKCVNPDHLEMVSIYQNSIRGEGRAAKALARDCCEKGHPYTIENTRRHFKKKTGRWWRICRQCHRERNKKHMLKKKSLLKA